MNVTQIKEKRKLATIRRIEAIKNIPDADRIQAYQIGGWWVVDSKDKYEVNQLVVFVEVDSFVPTEVAPFLSKDKEPREFNGIKGERLRTVKLKKQISQGLLLPLTICTKVQESYWSDPGSFEGSDVTDILGIIKWESPEEKIIPTNAKGSFPAFIPKTDQVRVQNIRRQYEDWVALQVQFEVTEKLDGSSMTVFVNQGIDGVCSRNLELKDEGENNGTFWATALELELHSKIRSTGRNLALQGELCGPGIQGNSYQLTKLHWFCYDIFDIDKQEYLLPDERTELLCKYDIPSVPIYFDLGQIIPATIEELIQGSNGNSLLNPKVKREGFVFKQYNSHNSFKVISPEWLLKKG
jgi:RNA ligase (TIGR02306 family)